MRALTMLILTGLAGCVTPAANFACASDADCSGGRCEADTKFCSFLDADCTSGHRYGDAAGGLSNECVADTAVCGDGMVTGDEECEDGNAVDSDRCVDCKLAKCGDGKVIAGIEDCDDGNTADGDSCNANCLACGAGSVTNPANNHCYTAIETALGFDAAALDCGTRGGYLTSIGDAAENSFVMGLLTSAQYWIGLDTSFFNGESLRWQDEDPFDLVASFNSWGSGEPSTNAQIDDCVGMLQAGTWDRQDCLNTRPYVCEREPWVIEPSTHHAYRRVTGRAEKTYANAVTACAATPGAHLVSITDDAENTFVRGLIKARRFWIGLDDLVTEGTYVWVSGEPTTFFGWGVSEPDAVNFALEDVVAIQDDTGWVTRDPAQGFSIDPYICEIDP